MVDTRMNRSQIAGACILSLVLFGSLFALGSFGPWGTLSRASLLEGIRVQATVETDPVPSRGDAADDPAVWVHPKDPAQSVIIGTDKQGGIAVYELSGKQLHYYAHGKLNNVDIRYGVQLGGSSVDLVAASNKSTNSFIFYKVDAETRGLINVTGQRVALSAAAYGFCLYRSQLTGKLYGFNVSKSGKVDQVELELIGERVTGRRIRTLRLGGQGEGCVADDETGVLYVGEERRGVWKFDAEPSSKNPGKLQLKVGEAPLVADVEGLALYPGRGGAGYLIVSSQGNHSFSVFERQGENRFVVKFQIGDGPSIDGVSDTDGIDVLPTALGPLFPEGVFIAQDGSNPGGNQNYKLVPWQVIARAGGEPLLIEPDFNPRD